MTELAIEYSRSGSRKAYSSTVRIPQADRHRRHAATQPRV